MVFGPASLVSTALALAVLVGAAEAVTFTVNSSNDAFDATLNGQCDTGRQIEITPGLFAAECTLRAAMEEANSNGNDTELDTVLFNIPLSACDPDTQVCTISPRPKLGGFGLPNITRPLVIDGYSQPGAKPNALRNGNDAVIRIHIDGGQWSGRPSVGLESFGGVIIKGLAITRFQTGISIGWLGARIEGNFIGVQPPGLRAGRNETGVSISVDQPFGSPPPPPGTFVIGGDRPAARNLISGNVVGCHVAFGTEILGNYIGTERSGTQRLGRVSQYGVLIEGENNTVGGATGASANVIAFNNIAGIAVLKRTDNNGVVVVRRDGGNAILRNSIFSNGEIGIDLRDDGRTANDFKDPDSGPNRRQNFPVLTSATSSASGTVVLGWLNTTPNTDLVIRFFSSPAGDQGHGYLGEQAVRTDAEGNVAFTFSSPRRLRPGRVITATATSAARNTSEFSDPQFVQ